MGGGFRRLLGLMGLESTPLARGPQICAVTVSQGGGKGRVSYLTCSPCGEEGGFDRAPKEPRKSSMRWYDFWDMP